MSRGEKCADEGFIVLDRINLSSYCGGGNEECELFLIFYVISHIIAIVECIVSNLFIGSPGSLLVSLAS